MRIAADEVLPVFFAFLLASLVVSNHVDGQNTFSISADRSTYNIADIVIVSGRVPSVIENIPLIISLISPDNAVYVIGQLMPAEDGSYRELLFLHENAMLLIKSELNKRIGNVK